MRLGGVERMQPLGALFQHEQIWNSNVSKLRLGLPGWLTTACSRRRRLRS
jgi:hypothetical protein